MQVTRHLSQMVSSEIMSISRIKENNKKIDTLYHLIYKGTCVCDQTYIGETIRNVDIRGKEHEDITKEPEPAKHLRENLNHKFKWETLFQAPKNYRQRKNLEASFIAIMGPTLNNQLNTKKLYLFRNGIT